MKILGVDPGKSTGLAIIEITNKKPRLTEARVSKDTTCFEWKDWLSEVDHIVVEDFKVRPGKARRGAFDYQQMETPKVISAIETLARLLDKTVILQQPSVKPIGYGFAQLKYVPGKQGVHIQDAAAHAMYFAVKRQLCLPSKLL